MKGNIGNGIMLIILALLVLLLYFRNENIIMAFFYLKKQKLEKSRKWLSRIKSPEKTLVRSQQAYYYYMLGLIEGQKSMTQSEKYLKKALSIGLGMKHDRAMAKLNLAAIAISKRRKREATNLLAEVKKLDKAKIFSEQIKAVKDQLKRI
ncbi:DUF2892 domain-containing protein [Ichthyobacterium seriolicida]|nr:DUF2892 domain-containing protein [Ichthyobacterium seriolicida]